MIIENYPLNNPHKDKVTDVIETLNLTFARKVTQIVAATVASLAEIQKTEKMDIHHQ